MADETRTANVNITADVSGYTQGTQQAIQSTNKLTDSLGKLTHSLDGITKRAGKKLLLFSAADLAVMTGFTLVAAKYEKQMSTLAAQAVLGSKNIQEYKKGIDSLAKSMPVARGEIAALVTQIEHLGVTSAKQSTAMAGTFSKMAAVTGEDVSQLTAGLIELSRTMGTLNNGNSGIERFAGSIATISAEAGVSATAVISFAQSIAPLARAAGIGQKELLGISTAFTKAGADGFAASNAFSTIISDINRLTMSGSPEIAKYANAVGMTVSEFKKMGATEQFTAIVESVSKAGPKAVQILNDMGIDGTRAAKAFAALSSESGGLKKAVQDAVDTYGNNNMNSAAAVAMDTLDAKSTQLRNNLEQMGAALGSAVLPVAKALMDVFNNILSIVNEFASPILKLAGGIASIVGIVSAAGGAMLTALGPLSTLMMAMTLFRLSPLRSLGSGIKDAVGTIRATPDSPYRMSQFGQLQARGALPGYQSVPYRLGQMAGGLAGRLPPGAAMLMRAGGTGVLRTVESFARANNIWYDNARRQPQDRVSMLSRRDAVQTPNAPFTRRELAANVLRNPRAFLSGLFQSTPEAYKGMPAADRLKDFDNYKKSLLDQAKATASNTAETIKEAGSKKALVQATGGATKAMLAYPMAATRMGVSVAGQALASPFRMLGGMLGLGGVAGGVMAGIGGLAYAVKDRNDSVQSALDGSRNIAAINAKLGIATEPLNDFVTSLTNGATAIKSVADAMNITAAQARQSYGGEFTDKNIKSLPDAKTATAYLRALGPMNAQQAAVAMQDIANNFGFSTASQIGDQYLSQTGNGTARPYSNQVVVDLMKGIQPTIDKNRGWSQGLKAKLPEEVPNLIAAAFTAVQQESNPYQGTLMPNGADLGQAISGTRINAMSGEIFNRNVDFLGGAGFNKGELQTEDLKRQAYIKTLEDAIGDEFDINVQDLRSIGSADQLTAYLSKYADKTAFAKYQEMTSGSISETALKSLLNFNPASAQGTALSQTTLGPFMRGNYYTNAVMTGSEDPKEVNKAIKALGEAALSTTGNFADASAALVDAKVAIGDTSSRAYAVAQAAEQRIQSINNYQMATTQGWAGTQGAQWQTSQALMRDPKTQPQGEEAMRSQQLEVQQRIGQTILAMEEYQIQKRQSLFDQNRQIDIAETQNNRSRLRAFQDFARQMGRAAVDFAKNMFDPYQRIANTGIMSIDYLIANGKQQVEVVKQQNKDVAALRKLGYTQDTIDANKWNDPAYAYQTSLILQQSRQDPSKVKDLNKITADKIREGGTLQEQQTGYQNQQEDFMRQMNRSAFDFATQMKLSAEAFDIATNRAEKAANRMGREAIGDIGTLWTQALELAGLVGMTNSSVMTSIGDFIAANPNVLNDTGATPGVPNVGIGKTYDTRGPLGTIKYDVSSTVSSNGSYSADWFATNNAGETLKLPDGFWYWNEKEQLLWMNGKNPNTGRKNPAPGGPGAGRPHTQTSNYGLQMDTFDAAAYQATQGGWSSSNSETKYMQTQPVMTNMSPETAALVGTNLKSVVSKGTQRSLATAGYSKGVSFKGGNTVITNTTHYTVTGDIRADDPERLGRELKKRERNDNLRKGANAKVGS